MIDYFKMLNKENGNKILVKKLMIQACFLKKKYLKIKKIYLTCFQKKLEIIP